MTTTIPTTLPPQAEALFAVIEAMLRSGDCEIAGEHTSGGAVRSHERRADPTDYPIRFRPDRARNEYQHTCAFHSPLERVLEAVIRDAEAQMWDAAPCSLRRSALDDVAWRVVLTRTQRPLTVADVAEWLGLDATAE